MLIVALTLAVGIGAAVYVVGSDARRLKVQLDLGQKYLEELDYEQAQIVFEQAIEIEPKCVEAYEKGNDCENELKIFDAVLSYNVGRSDTSS